MTYRNVPFAWNRVGRLVLSMVCVVVAFGAMPHRALAASTCSQFGTINFSPYRMVNDTWNVGEAGPDWWECVYYNSSTSMGFDWHFPYIGNDNVKAYPSIRYERITGASQMPIQVSANKPIKASWSFDLSGVTGRWNASYDLWFDTYANTGSDFSPTTELMVWLNAAEDLDPYLPYQGTFSIAGASWRAYYSPAGQDQDWGFIIYKRVGDVTSVSNLDLNAFIQHSRSKGWVNRSHWAWSVRGGFEIVHGDGSPNFSRYTISH